MQTKQGGKSRNMAEEAEENRIMTPEAKHQKKKLVQLRDGLWAFAKLVGGVAAYIYVLALVVGHLTARVSAESMSLNFAMVSAVYYTAVIHVLIGMLFICQD